jgi:hypothetical protein
VLEYIPKLKLKAFDGSLITCLYPKAVRKYLFVFFEYLRKLGPSFPQVRAFLGVVPRLAYAAKQALSLLFLPAHY